MVGADVADPDAVDQAVAGSDAVLSSLGVPLTPKPITVWRRRRRYAWVHSSLLW